MRLPPNPPSPNPPVPPAREPRTFEVGGFRLCAKGRFWQVFDPQGRLIVTSVYKKGGIEVIRRLLPPYLRPLADGPWDRTPSAPRLTRTAYNPRSTNSAGHKPAG